MSSAVDVARGILTNAAKRDVALSDAELHRLAMRAQAWFMASHERPLFEEPIIAGANGPVVPAIRAAQENGGIARFSDDDEGYEVLGEYAFWQTTSAVLDHIGPLLGEDEINAEVDGVAARTACEREVDREALACRVREELEKRQGPSPDPEAALRHLDEDPELLQRILDRAGGPHDNDFRPR